MKKKHCYIIIEKKSKMLQGAFPYTDEGKIKAEKYLKKMDKNKDFKIETL